MTAGDKLTALLAHLGVNTDGTVDIDGHTYQGWDEPEDPDPAKPHGAPYEFRTLKDGRRQLRITVPPDGELRVAAGDTIPEAIDAMAAKLNVKF